MTAVTEAIVTYQSEDPKKLNWKLQQVNVRTELKPHELLIDMKSSGICHSDIFFSGDVPEPRILGHEGTGIVKAIGKDVTVADIGDPVLLSFSSCGDCRFCKADVNGYCKEFMPLNILDTDHEKSFSLADGTKLSGKFFGQSSFAKLSIVNEASVVNVKKYNLTEEQFIMLGPLGCGFQTGAGAVYNAAGANEKTSVAIYGLGGVGFGGLMAAKVAGANPIIAVDLFDDKLQIAKELGATHIIKGGDDEAVHKQVMEITNGGSDIGFECVGRGAKFIENALKNCAIRGKVVYVGASDASSKISIPTFEFMEKGQQLIGCTEGDANPHKFIPQMIEWHIAGNFPIEKIEKTYAFEDYETALADMAAGKVIKAILKY